MPRRQLRRAAAALAGLLLTAAPAAPAALALLPGDAAIGAAWGEQANPRIAAGGGSYLAVWSDDRAHEGKSDIYGIRLDPAGRPIDPVAFAIDQNDGAQTVPQVAWNGQSWLVAWLDEGQLAVTRVGTDGRVLDPPSVVASPGASASLALASDGSGWALIWAGVNAGNAATRGARIAPSGQVLDPGGVEILPETFFVRGNLSLAWAVDRWLLVWPESTSSTGWDILGNLLSPALVPTEPAPRSIAATVNDDNAPALASNGASFYLVWKEMDGSGWVNGISGTRVGLDGVATEPTGVAIGDRRSWGEAPDVTWDGSQWIAAWTALGAFAARIDATGRVLDPAGVELAAATDFDQREVALAGLPGGGARALWKDYRNHQENDIWMGGLRADGTAEAGAVVSLGLPSQQRPRMVWNGAGYAIAFASYVSGRSRILVARLDPDGVAIDPEPVEVAAGDVIEPGIAWSGQRYLVTWRRRAAVGVEARRLGPDLTPQDAAPIAVMTGENPAVAAVGDQFLVTAENNPSGWQFRDVYGQRIDGPTGQLVGPLIGLFGAYAWGSTVGAIGNRWLVAWEGHGAHNTSPFNLAYAWVATDGSSTPVGGLAGGSGWGTSGLSIAGHPALGALAYSTTRMPSASDGEIFLLRVAADGSLPDGVTGIPVTGTVTGEQYAPATGWTGSAFLTAFQDTRSRPGPFFFPRSDIYAARVDAGGAVLDPGGGIPLETQPVPEREPAVAGDGGRAMVAASHLIGGVVGALRIGARAVAGAPRLEAGPLLAAKAGPDTVHLVWATTAGATSYDLVRGDLAAIQPLASRTDLGPVSCVAGGTTLVALDDPAAPAPPPGEAWFWQLRANDGSGPGTYGWTGPGRELTPSSGDCP